MTTAQTNPSSNSTIPMTTTTTSTTAPTLSSPATMMTTNHQQYHSTTPVVTTNITTTSTTPTTTSYPIPPPSNTKPPLSTSSTTTATSIITNTNNVGSTSTLISNTVSSSSGGSSRKNNSEESVIPARAKIEQAEFLQSQRIHQQVLDLGLYKTRNKTSLKVTDEDFARICKLVQLTELDLTGNEIKDLPDCIVQLSSLKVLKLNRNGLKSLPKNLDLLSHSLQEIHLQLNELSTWPQNLNKFQCLETLDLSFNHLNKLALTNSGGILSSILWSNTPSTFPIQHTLKSLNLSFNELTQFPAKVVEFTNLQNLKLSKNQIEEIPEIITRLNDSLTSLSIDKCNLTKFPDHVCSLFNLKVLNLSENKFGKLPRANTHLRNLALLEEFYANGCDLIGWSQLLCQAKLRILHMSSNKILGFPTETKTLRFLKELRLNKNQISHIPEHITFFTELEILDLSDNTINEIDESFGKMSNLQVLNFSNNEITELPASMKYLTKLQVLDVSNNMLEKLFDWDQMQDLREVKAANNQIRTFPKGVESNVHIQTTLTSIDFSMNKLTELPDSFYMLRSLMDVRLKHNVIEKLDEKICNLENLEEINLENNEISSIPASISHLSKLKFLRMSYNTQFLDIPEEVIKWVTESKIEFTTEFEVASKVFDKLYIGSAMAATNKKLLRSYGVTHVLTIANDIPPKHTADFKYMVIYTDDMRTASLKAHFRDAFNFITEGIESGGCIVHCMAGVSRSATIVTSFLMQYKQLRARAALFYLGKRRNQVNPNQTFRAELQQFDLELHGEASVEEKPKNRYLISDPVSGERTIFYPDGRIEKERLVKVREEDRTLEEKNLNTSLRYSSDSSNSTASSPPLENEPGTEEVTPITPPIEQNQEGIFILQEDDEEQTDRYRHEPDDEEIINTISNDPLDEFNYVPRKRSYATSYEKSPVTGVSPTMSQLLCLANGIEAAEQNTTTGGSPRSKHRSSSPSWKRMGLSLPAPLKFNSTSESEESALAFMKRGMTNSSGSSTDDVPDIL